MKKFIFFIGCLALLVAGCNKEQNIEKPKQEAPRHLTFDIAVNYSDDTRAVKKEWEENDKIYVFFDLDKNTEKVEYMTMTFDGRSSWSHTFSNGTMEADLLKKTEGKLYAVYFPIGTPEFSISKYNDWTSIRFNLDSEIGEFFRTNYSSSLGDQYNISAEGKLTASLQMSLGEHDIQFFVPGIAETEVKNYLFSCDQMVPAFPAAISFNSTGRYEAAINTGTRGGQMKGYYYKDGVVFSGQLHSDAIDYEVNYIFTITDTKGTTDENDDVKYTLTVSDKKLTRHDAVKLPALNSGRWTIDDGHSINGHEYVDLGLSVKWATMNVGANSETEYGNYFAWGETEPKDYYSWNTYKWMQKDHSSVEPEYYITKYTFADNQTQGIWYNGGTFIGDNKTVLEFQDDAARANWGGSWRMPTSAEIAALLTLEIQEWVTDYEGSGINGYKFTGNGKTIFLPAAGSRYGTSLYSVGSAGAYWSSSLRGEFVDAEMEKSDFACYLRFDPQEWGFGSLDYRLFGFSIRPVSD